MKVQRSLKEFVFNSSLSFALALYTFRMYFFGYLIGEGYDSRLMISQHEHWYRLFFKNGKFRDTLIFYPRQDALGYTDAFLVPSVFYVPLRFFNFGILQAWTIATFLTLFIGFLGWAYLINFLIKNPILKISLFLSITLYPAWVAEFEVFPNAAGYTLLSWLILLLIKIFKDFEKINLQIYLNLLVFLTVVALLTSWYPALFFILLTIVTVTIFSLTDINSTKIALRKFFKTKLGFISTTLLTLNIAAISLWLAIYLPNFKETGGFRPWFVTIDSSASFADLLNIQRLNNGLTYLILNRRTQFEIDAERLGFPLFLIIFTLILLVVLLFNFRAWKKTYYDLNKIYRVYTKLILLPGLILGLIFLKLTDDFSIFKIMWQFIPGFNSIRYPYRYFFVLGFLLWIFIYMTMDIYLKNLDQPIKKTLIYIILIVGALDNLKPYYSFWKPDDYVPASIYKHADFITNNCDYFILDRPGGWWDDSTNAISMSSITGIPTANGQSSGYPSGYPTKPLFYEGDITDTLEWAQFGISSKKGCFVSDSFTPLISEPIEPRVETYDGFSPKEGGETDYWSWATRSDPILFVSTIANSRNNILDIQIKTPPCLQERELTFVALPDTQLKKITIDAKSSNYSIQIPPSRYNLTKIQIFTNDEFCKIENDPRDLFFEIKNYKIN